jgi:hypothetical protein
VSQDSKSCVITNYTIEPAPPVGLEPTTTWLRAMRSAD